MKKYLILMGLCCTWISWTADHSSAVAAAGADPALCEYLKKHQDDQALKGRMPADAYEKLCTISQPASHHAAAHESGGVGDVVKKVVPTIVEHLPNIGTKIPSHVFHHIREAGKIGAEFSEKFEEALHHAPDQADAVFQATFETWLSGFAEAVLEEVVVLSSLADHCAHHVEHKAEHITKSHGDAAILDELSLDLQIIGIPARVIRECAQQLGSALKKIGVDKAVKAVGAQHIPAYPQDNLTTQQVQQIRERFSSAIKKNHIQLKTAPEPMRAAYQAYSSKSSAQKSAAQSVDHAAAAAATDTLNRSSVTQQLFQKMQEAEARVKQVTTAQATVQQAGSPVSQALAEKELLARQEEFIEFKDTVSDFCKMASMALYAAGDKQMAGKITSFGAGFVMAASGIAAATGTATAASIGLGSSMFGPAAPIAMGIGMMAYAIFSDDEAVDSGLQQQLMAIHAAVLQVGRALSEQIAATHKDTIEHLIALDKKADQRTRDLYVRLFGLLHHADQHTHEIKAILHELKPYVMSNKDSFASMTSMMMRHHQEINSQFAALRIEEVEELLEQINKAKIHGLTPQLLEAFIRDLHTKIIVKAKSPALTGDDVNSTNYTAVQERLNIDGQLLQENMYKHPAFSHVALLKKYGESKSETFNDKKLPMVASPLILLRSAHSIIDLLAFAHERKIGFESEEKRAACLQEVQEILNYVQNLEAVFSELKQANLLNGLVDDYIQDFHELDTVIAEYKATYHDEKLSAQLQQRIQAAAQTDISIIETMDPVQHDLLRKQLNNVCDILQRYLDSEERWGWDDDNIWNHLRFKQNPQLNEEFEEIKTFTNGRTVRRDCVDEIVQQETRKQVLYRRALVNFLKKRAQEYEIFVGDNIDSLFVARNFNKPLSCLVHPTDPDRRLPVLAYPALEVEPKYARKELLGEAIIRAEYVIEPHNTMRINLYKIEQDNKECIDTVVIPHNLRPEQIDYDSILAWWNGMSRSSEMPDAVTIEGVAEFPYPLKKAHPAVVERHPLNFYGQHKTPALHAATIAQHCGHAVILPTDTVEQRIKFAIEQEREYLAALKPIPVVELRRQIQHIADSCDCEPWEFFGNHGLTWEGDTALVEEVKRLGLEQRLTSIPDLWDQVSLASTYKANFDQHAVDASIQYKDARKAKGIPLTQLIYPTGNPTLPIGKECHPLIITKGLLVVDPDYVQKELDGKGRIRAEYDICAQCIEVNVYFVYNAQGAIHRDSIQRYVVPHSIPFDRVTPEAIQFWWHGGGRWAQPHDKIVVRNSDNSRRREFMFPAKESPWKDDTRGLAQLSKCIAQVHVDVAADTTEKRSQLLEEFNAHMVHDAEIPSETNKLALVLRKHDVHYKMLEAVSALLLNEEFLKHQATDFFRSGAIRNYETFLRYVRNYTQPRTRGIYQLPTILADARRTCEKIKQPLVQVLTAAPFPMLSDCLSGLQRAVLRLPVLPIQAPFVDRPLPHAADITALQEAQQKLRLDLDSMRSEQQQFFGFAREQFAMLVAVLAQQKIVPVEQAPK